MRALICGAGIAGLTLAWHLERAGWHVELVDKAPEFRTGGYMIDFYGPGLKVAERMGIEPRLREHRSPVRELSYVRDSGRVSSSFTIPDSVDGLVSLLRGDLARAIADEVRSPVRYGTSVEAVEQRDGVVDVRLTDGSSRQVDLLVGADGIHSRIRELLFARERDVIRYLGHHVAAYVKTDARLADLVGIRYRSVSRPGRTAGAYAMGENQIATMFLAKTADRALPSDARERLRAEFDGVGWIVPELLEQCPPSAEVYYDEVSQIVMSGWSRGRVVLLGDACQAVSLFAGHGASLGIAAAEVLAGQLAEVVSRGEFGDDAALAAALDGYEQRMQPTVAETQQLGQRVVEWLAPSSWWRILVRDAMLNLARVPILRGRFLDSLTLGSHSLIKR